VAGTPPGTAACPWTRRTSTIGPAGRADGRDADAGDCRIGGAPGSSAEDGNSPDLDDESFAFSSVG
jgi:hypothetical protein